MGRSVLSRSAVVLSSAALVAFAYACGGDDDDGLGTNADADAATDASGGADGGSTAPDGGEAPNDAGGNTTDGGDATDGGDDADAGASTLSVSPATFETIVGGAPLDIAATLTDSSESIAWTLAGPGSVLAASGTSTTYRPPGAGALGVAKVTATAGALTATSVIRVNRPPKRTVVAYAFANNQAAASYTPSGTYSYNAAGGAITATRSGPGQYAMTFASLSLGHGDVQVTAYDSNRRCSVQSWSGSSVQVRCFAPDGTPADSQYTVSVVLDDVYSAASVAAFAWANDASSASYAPSSTYSYNSAGGAITATRSGVGTYAMTFADLPMGSGNVQVSAYDTDKNCTVLGWGASTVNVRCHDAAGNPADSRYVVTVILNDRFSTANVAAYAWGNNPTAASYTPSANYSFNSSGGAITATRSAAGTYAMTFAGLELASGNVKVSAYASGRQCNVQSWFGPTVNVRCYDAAGALADTAYTVMATLNSDPVASRVAAYALANDPASASYTPAAARSYNASGGAITATRTATGTYTMRFAGQSFGAGDVQVTGYGSNATCNVSSWIGPDVFVRCYDPAGALVDSRYVVTVYANGIASAANTVAYAWANESGTASYTPDPLFSYNAGGGAVTAARSDKGMYTITFSGLVLNGGAVQVTGHSTFNDCVVHDWTGSTVEVRCYDGAGDLADGTYTVNVVLNDRLSAASSLAYAWTDDESTASYPLTNGYTYNASAQPITATRLSTGVYSTQFPGLDLERGSVSVSAYGSNARCTLLGWGGEFITVRCANGIGQPMDSRFTVIHTR